MTKYISRLQQCGGHLNDRMWSLVRIIGLGYIALSNGIVEDDLGSVNKLVNHKKAAAERE